MGAQSPKSTHGLDLMIISFFFFLSFFFLLPLFLWPSCRYRAIICNFTAECAELQFFFFFFEFSIIRKSVHKSIRIQKHTHTQIDRMNLNNPKAKILLDENEGAAHGSSESWLSAFYGVDQRKVETICCCAHYVRSISGEFMTPNQRMDGRMNATATIQNACASGRDRLEPNSSAISRFVLLFTVAEQVTIDKQHWIVSIVAECPGRSRDD